MLSSKQFKGHQETLFDYAPKPQYDPVAHIRAGADAFTRERHGRGINWDGLNDVQVRGAEAHRVARQYADAPVVDDSARPAFEAMRRETGDQFDYLTRPREQGGMGVAVEFQDEDPYPDAQTMADDVRANNRLRIHKTGPDEAHPFFAPEENDRFRAVHDAFGHLGVGRTFSRHGEEAAYRLHAQMYSPEARPALTTETRGQNAFLNYGPEPGTFGPQKLATLQDETPVRRPTRRPRQERLF